MAPLDQSDRSTEAVEGANRLTRLFPLQYVPDNSWLKCRLQMLCLVQTESNSKVSESDVNSASIFSLFLGNCLSQVLITLKRSH